MLQLLAVRMRMRSEGGVGGDSTRVVQRHGPHVGGSAGSKGIGGDGPDVVRGGPSMIQGYSVEYPKLFDKKVHAIYIYVY
jgi:hypothetical protein